jgi:hypothetical protein
MFVVLTVFLIQTQLRRIIYNNQSREDGSSDEFRKAFISNTSQSTDSVQRTINVIRQPLLQIFSHQYFKLSYRRGVFNVKSLVHETYDNSLLLFVRARELVCVSESRFNSKHFSNEYFFFDV